MFIRSTLAVAAFAILATSGIAFAASSSASSSAASSATDADKQFLTSAIEGDNSEMALGGIALARGSTVAVRDFGFTLITDHRKAKIGAEDIAGQLGVTTPDDIKPEARDEMQKLMGLSGTAFDQEFASYMVQDHTKDIADFKDEAKNKDQVGTYAAKTLPTLEKHLSIAQSLQSGTSGASSSSAASAAAPASSSAM
jgi:putative membrane protein